MARSRVKVGLVALAAMLTLTACGQGGGGGGGGGEETLANGKTGPITYVTGKDTSGWVQPTIDKWNAAHPNEKVTLIELPESANDQRNQMVTTLQAKSDRYGILYTDVVWTAEFAKSGWLEEIPKDQIPEFSGMLKGPVDSVTFEGKTWAVPAASDGGMLYYRKDILDKEGKQPPKTWDELATMAKEIAPKYNMAGYSGQFFKYEGLTVNAMEAIWGAGGEALAEDGTKVVVDSPEARKGIDTLVNGFKQGWIPKEAITYKEEESRRAFQQGKLLFLRNWPYVYALASKPGKESAVAGKFAVAKLPGPSALGGHNHAISKFTKNKKTALEFIKFLTAPEQQRTRLEKAVAPVSGELYDDPAFKKQFPFLPVLKESIDTAKNRPITPYYNDVHLAIEEAVYPALQGTTSTDQAIKDLAGKLQEAIQG
jgi:multiple sugar transport system substrate-binding protein